MYSLERHKVVQGNDKMQSGILANNSMSLYPRARQMLVVKEENLLQQKLESYKTGRTGDHRPDVEQWHDHRRVTMWNKVESQLCHEPGRSQFKLIPPRLLQRPMFRLGAPALTIRQAELYGLLPYRQPGEELRQKVERAVIRGVRFVEGVYTGRDFDGKELGCWKMSDGKFCSSAASNTVARETKANIPICLATMEILKPSLEGCTYGLLTGQDKYLGGMTSPCGRYIFGVPVSKIKSNS